ncbi:glycosyltransferase [Vibrio breoganii]
MSLKVLYIITDLGMGGAETQVCSLADKVAELGHNVTIVYLTGELVVSPKNRKVKLIPLDMKKNNFSLVSSIFRLSRLIKSISPDVVHSHMIHANLITRVLRIFTPMNKLVCTAHNADEGGKLRMLLYRLTDNLCDVFTNVGQTAVDSFIKKKASPSNRIISVVNGIDTDVFKPGDINEDYSTIDSEFPSGKRIFLAVGRLDIQKDYSNLLTAISKIPDIYDYHVVIVGFGTDLLKDEVYKLGIENRVSLLGLRKDVALLMKRSDALVMSSAWEGLPIVIGEAMSTGCNIVCTDAGGCKEWLSPLESVVATKNSELLADALIAKLSLDNEDWNHIGIRNRQHIIDNFSIESVTNKWIELYR